MKRITLLLTLLVCALFTFAQQDVSSGKNKSGSNDFRQNKKQRAAQMAKMLNLTDSQKAQIKSIQSEQQKKMQDLEKEQQISLKEYNDRKTAIRKEAKTKREAVLTTEQKQKKESVKEIQQKEREVNVATKQLKMSERLNLTSDQSRQLKEMQQKNKAEVDKIKNDSKLNDQQKAIKLRELRQSSKSSREKIFTPEQQEKINAMKTKKGESEIKKTQNLNQRK